MRPREIRMKLGQMVHKPAKSKPLPKSWGIEYFKEEGEEEDLEEELKIHMKARTNNSRQDQRPSNDERARMWRTITRSIAKGKKTQIQASRGGEKRLEVSRSA